MIVANCLLDPPDAVAMRLGINTEAASGIFRVKTAVDSWERREYQELRRQVFCDEQAMFSGSDEDEHDASPTCQLIVALSYAAVMDHEVVGGVRIYEQSPGIWFGSRLAIRSDWRGVPSLAQRLIQAAVGTARARGANTFLATVQRQNVPLFRRLRWRGLGDVQVCGRPHQLMQADFDH